MKAGFLILNYNSWELSKNLALKVSQYHYINKIVIVDNCSSDDSYQILKTMDNQKIDVIQSEKNGGYAYGNNYGAKYCEKYGLDILFFSNPDVDIEEEDVNKIIDGFQKSNYAVLSGIEYDINRNLSQPPIWKQMSYKDDLLDCFFIGRKLCKAKKGIELNSSVLIQEVELVKGSFLGVRLDKFLAVGGFDEGTFLFCEERILGKRMALVGEKMGVVTNAIYYHNHSTIINKSYSSVAKQINLLYQSRMYFYRTYSNVGKVKLNLLFFSMRWSLFEYMLVDRIRSWRKA